MELGRELSDAEAKDRFIRGLKKRTQFEVVKTDLIGQLSLKGAMDIASAFDEVLYQEKSSTSYDKGIWPIKNPVKSSETKYYRSTEPVTVPKELGAASRRPQKEPVICWSCNKPGHIKARCPQEQDNKQKK